MFSWFASFPPKVGAPLIKIKGVDTWLGSTGSVLDVKTIAVMGDHDAVVLYSWVTLIALYEFVLPTTPSGKMVLVFVPPIFTTSIWKFRPNVALILEYPTYFAGKLSNIANNGALKYRLK